jgi:hypothetical protein
MRITAVLGIITITSAYGALIWCTTTKQKIGGDTHEALE